jgi:hypothetical protein
MGQAATVPANEPGSTELVVPELIQLLSTKARADGLSGAELSRQLGVDTAQWWRVRRGLERFGPNVIARMVELFPELQEPAIRYLSERFDPPTLRLMAEASRAVDEAEARTHDARSGAVESGDPTG